MVLGLGLNFYTPVEFLVALLSASLLIFLLGLGLLSVFFVRHASNWVLVRAQAASWKSAVPPRRLAAVGRTGIIV